MTPGLCAGAAIIRNGGSAIANNAVRWFEIYVQDTARARAFYGAVFEIKLQRLNTPEEIWAFPAVMDQTGIGGALVRMPGVPSGGNSTIVYFGCDDCAVQAARVVAAGGRQLTIPELVREAPSGRDVRIMG